MTRRGALVLATLSALAGGPARAAGEVLVSLDYEAAPGLAGCPSAAEFRAEVTRQLRRDPFRDGASLHLGVRLYPRGGGLGGRMEWRDLEGQWEGNRTFTAANESCAGMARTVGVATAIQIELLASLGRGGATASPAPAAGEQPSPSPVPAVIQASAQASGQAAAPPAPAPKEPLFGATLGIGALHDLGGAPTFAVPRLALWVGRPERLALRLAASGLGPGARVSSMEGSAALDLFLATLDAVRWFRSDRRLQLLVTAGVGVRDLRIRGTSAMPTLTAAHDGQKVAGLITAGAGAGLALARRIVLVAEGDLLLFQPALTVDIGRSTPAHMNGVTLFIHGGLLARF